MQPCPIFRFKLLAIRVLVQEHVEANINENVKAPRHCIVVSVWPNKGPVMRKSFPGHDVMYYVGSHYTLWGIRFAILGAIV